MSSVSLFAFFLLSHFVLLPSAEEEKSIHPNCPSFQCGKFSTIGFPFAKSSHPRCGLLTVNCDETTPTIQLPLGRRSTRPYEVISISHINTTQYIRVKDLSLWEYLNTNKCEYLLVFTNFTLPNSPFMSFKLITPIQTLFKCNRTLRFTSPRNTKKMRCGDYKIYHTHSNKASQSFPSGCSTIQLPVQEHSHKDELIITAEFELEVHVSDACSSCYSRGGLCKLIGNRGKFHCNITEKDIDNGITQKGLYLHIYSKCM